MSRLPGQTPARSTSWLTLDERASHVRHIPGRDAAVALALVPHVEHGPVVLTVIRTTVNGHTGARMSHAGDLVMPGGALEPGELPAEAALRELREETGTLGLKLTDFVVLAALGCWVTESGFGVEGYLVQTASRFAEAALADGREVAELVYIPLDELYAAEAHLAWHRVHAQDRAGVTGAIETRPGIFQSPTLRVLDVNGRARVLWGAAGFMATRLRDMFPTPDLLLPTPGALSSRLGDEAQFTS